MFRVTRKVTRRVKHCSRFTGCVTSGKFIMYKGSRLNRNGSMGSISRLKFVTRGGNSGQLMSSVRVLAGVVGGECPSLPCFLFNRDVNSFYTEICATRFNSRLGKTIFYKAKRLPTITTTLRRPVGGLYRGLNPRAGCRVVNDTVGTFFGIVIPSGASPLS